MEGGDTTGLGILRVGLESARGVRLKLAQGVRAGMKLK
jgi:hypothetical protein